MKIGEEQKGCLKEGKMKGNGCVSWVVGK